MQKHSQVLGQQRLADAAAIEALNREIKRIQLFGEFGISDALILPAAAAVLLKP